MEKWKPVSKKHGDEPRLGFSQPVIIQPLFTVQGMTIHTSTYNRSYNQVKSITTRGFIVDVAAIVINRRSWTSELL